MEGSKVDEEEEEDDDQRLVSASGTARVGIWDEVR